jgi:tRNA(Met) C34 N-acetyltransferase TmcA
LVAQVSERAFCPDPRHAAFVRRRSARIVRRIYQVEHQRRGIGDALIGEVLAA